MKKILIFLMLLLQTGFTFASDLEVKTNLESGEYEFVIEVNIIASQKDAKIFYYTDGEGRMDNIKEFTKPILLKENTTIDFYATSKDFEDTLIQTSKYTFNYSNKIDIGVKNGKIEIKNNSGNIQNIGYWKIEADNLNYEINPNTFLENKENFEIDYNLKNNEHIKLISPDNKVIKTFNYKKEIQTTNKKGQSQELPLQEINVGVDLVSIQEKSENNLEQSLEQSETGEIIEEKKEFDLSENIKTSTIETKKTGNKNNIYIITLIFGVLMLYNIGLLLTKTETYKKIKNKKK